jgi:serine phosphatase RsbU (regulator of sigma subunit)
MSDLRQFLAQLEADGLIRLVRVEPELEYSFRHELLQEAIYRSLLASEAQAWHRAVGAALEELYPERLDSSELAPTLAHHFLEAGDHEQALKYLTEAGDAALACFANLEAAQHYRQALELTEPEQDRVQLLSGLGLAYSRQGRFAKAIEVWREAIEICRTRGDTDGMARLYARSARAAWYGDVSQSLKVCQEGLDAIGDAREGPEMARLLHEAARAHFFNGMPDRALSLCQQALSMAERLGVIDVEADALATLGMLHDDAPEVALRALTRAVELAEANDLPYQAARAHTNLSYLLHSAMADFRSARDHDRRAAELGRQRGSIAGEILSLGTVAHSSLLLGEFAEAEATLASLRRLQAELGDTGTVDLQIQLNEGRLLRYHGALEEAAHLLRTCQVVARRQNNLDVLSAADVELADALLELAVQAREERQPIASLMGEAERALEETIEVSERAGWTSVRARCLLAMARSIRGDLESAQQVLADARECASPPPSRFDELWLAWAEAMIARTDRQWSEAVAAFERTANIAASLGVRWWWAHSLQAWASAHLTRAEPSDLERARALLREAGTIFRELGTPYYVGMVEQKLQAVRERSYALSVDQQRATEELAVAGRVQAGLLPSEVPHLPEWDILATLEPARETSGDFYDFIVLPEGKLGFVVADVADKGAGAALYMALSRTLIRTFALEHPDAPERVMSETNSRILKDAKETMFVTVFYGVVDPLRGTVTYCNAGHNPPYFLSGQADSTVQELTRNGMALGVLEQTDYDRATLRMSPGDALVLYTDGVTDARNAAGKMYGEERLLEVTQRAQGCSARGIQEALLDDVHRFVGNAPRADDITLMVLAMECAPEMTKIADQDR